MTRYLVAQSRSARESSEADKRLQRDSYKIRELAARSSRSVEPGYRRARPHTTARIPRIAPLCRKSPAAGEAGVYENAQRLLPPELHVRGVAAESVNGNALVGKSPRETLTGRTITGRLERRRRNSLGTVAPDEDARGHVDW